MQEVQIGATRMVVYDYRAILVVLKPDLVAPCSDWLLASDFVAEVVAVVAAVAPSAFSCTWIGDFGTISLPEFVLVLRMLPIRLFLVGLGIGSVEISCLTVEVEDLSR